MTVASETSRNDYVGNGATATYSYTFRIFAATDLLVTRVNTAGVETELTYPTDYTVAGVGSFGGGTITLTAGNLTSGYGLAIRFKTTLTQGVDLRNQAGFFPETIEDALDRLIKVDQQQQDEVDRSIKLPETETGTMVLPTVTERANSFLGFDANGDPISGTALTSSVPATAFAETLIDDTTAGEMVETLRNGLTAETTVVSDDEVIIRDTSATTGKRITVRNLMKVITELATETAPDAADEVAIYDASAATADKVTLTVLAEAIRALSTAKRSPGAAENYSLSAVPAANALTITLAGAGGTALSATNKAQFSFRSVTAGAGTTEVVDATADLTLVLSSGSTAGATSGQPFRAWIVIFNDGGTLRLGAINCSTATAIYPLADDIIASASAEGGAGAADSAGVIYAGAAVTAKAMRVLGYMEFSLTTAGTWDEAPDKIQLWQPGMKLPGDTVQSVFNSTGTLASTATPIPNDNTIPQNTEGAEITTATITPTSTCNPVHISAGAVIGGSGAGTTAAIAVFADSGANALAASAVHIDGANTYRSISLVWVDTPSTAASRTYKLRYGVNSGTAYLNCGGTASAANALFGGVERTTLAVREIMG